MGTNKSQNFRINVYGDTAQFISSTEGSCYLRTIWDILDLVLYIRIQHFLRLLFGCVWGCT